MASRIAWIAFARSLSRSSGCTCNEGNAFGIKFVANGAGGYSIATADAHGALTTSYLNTNGNTTDRIHSTRRTRERYFPEAFESQ